MEINRGASVSGLMGRRTTPALFDTSYSRSSNAFENFRRSNYRGGSRNENVNINISNNSNNNGNNEGRGPGRSMPHSKIYSMDGGVFHTATAALSLKLADPHFNLPTETKVTTSDKGLLIEVQKKRVYDIHQNIWKGLGP